MKFSKTLLAICILSGLIGCDNGSNVDAISPAASQAESGGNSTYAQLPTRDTWPDMSGGGNESVAVDLLAKNYYIVVDGSGSMGQVSCTNGGTRMSAAQEAVSQFVKQLPNGANIGLYAFDYSGAKERVALGQGNVEKVISNVNSISSNGGTPLKSAIATGYRALTAQAKTQLGYGDYNLVVVTDGAASSGEHPDTIVDVLINESPVNLHTIGFCIGDSHALNKDGYAFYHNANTPDQLSAGLSAVLAEAPSFDVGGFQGVN